MPIYEYECERCQKVFEILVLSRSEKVTCPQCGGEDLKRLMSVCAISTSEGFRSTISSGCSSCSATSCATCKP